MKPALCGYHATVLRNLRQRHPHLTKNERASIAHDLWRQCCVGPRTPLAKETP